MSGGEYLRNMIRRKYVKEEERGTFREPVEQEWPA